MEKNYFIKKIVKISGQTKEVWLGTDDKREAALSVDTLVNTDNLSFNALIAAREGLTPNYEYYNTHYLQPGGDAIASGYVYVKVENPIFRPGDTGDINLYINEALRLPGTSINFNHYTFTRCVDTYFFKNKLSRDVGTETNRMFNSGSRYYVIDVANSIVIDKENLSLVQDKKLAEKCMKRAATHYKKNKGNIEETITFCSFIESIHYTVSNALNLYKIRDMLGTASYLYLADKGIYENLSCIQSRLDFVGTMWGKKKLNATHDKLKKLFAQILYVKITTFKNTIKRDGMKNWKNNMEVLQKLANKTRVKAYIDHVKYLEKIRLDLIEKEDKFKLL